MFADIFKNKSDYGLIYSIVELYVVIAINSKVETIAKYNYVWNIFYNRCL